MKKTVAFLIFLSIAVLANGQIHTTLALPNPCSSIGLPDVKQKANMFELMVYPNPNNGVFQLNLTGKGTLGDLSIEFRSIQGKLVCETQIHCFEDICVKSFTGWSFPPGIYYVSVTNSDNRVSRMVVIY